MGLAALGSLVSLWSNSKTVFRDDLGAIPSKLVFVLHFGDWAVTRMVHCTPLYSKDFTMKKNSNRRVISRTVNEVEAGFQQENPNRIIGATEHKMLNQVLPILALVDNGEAFVVEHKKFDRSYQRPRKDSYGNIMTNSDGETLYERVNVHRYVQETRLVSAGWVRIH